jgi:hypothetical protein
MAWGVARCPATCPGERVELKRRAWLSKRPQRTKGALYSAWVRRRSDGGGAMGVKWTARLKVDFEMDEGTSANLAEARLKVSAAEL